MVTTSQDDDGDSPTTEVIHVTLSQVSTFGCARPLLSVARVSGQYIGAQPTNSFSWRYAAAPTFYVRICALMPPQKRSIAQMQISILRFCWIRLTSKTCLIKHVLTGAKAGISSHTFAYQPASTSACLRHTPALESL